MYTHREIDINIFAYICGRLCLHNPKCKRHAHNEGKRLRRERPQAVFQPEAVQGNNVSCVSVRRKCESLRVHVCVCVCVCVCGYVKVCASGSGSWSYVCTCMNVFIFVFLYSTRFKPSWSRRPCCEHGTLHLGPPTLDI